MSSKQFTLSNGRVVTVCKRRNSRNIRLSLVNGQKVRVSIPYWAPYSSGLKFAESKISWISSETIAPEILSDGQAIGKNHRLKFIADSIQGKPKTRVLATEVVVRHSVQLDPKDPMVQQAAHHASITALRKQAEHLLPQRLADLAHTAGYGYKSLKIKKMSSRWGSCDSHQNIVLNLYLMILPWKYIDYVILHELCHTKVLRHGPEFWMEMEKHLQDAKNIRKEMRSFQPILMGASDKPVA